MSKYFIVGVFVLRVFVSPLGFHEDVVLKLLTEYRAGPSDRLFIVTCGLVGGVKSAYESLKAMCIRQGFPEPELIELDCNDVYGSLKILSEKLGSVDADEYVLEIGAGMRIAGYMALFALIKHGRRFEIHYRSEGTGLTLTIPWEYLDLLLHGLRDSEHRVLKLIVENPGITVKELALMLERKEKSIRNIVSQLKGKGLVEKKGPHEKLYPTKMAEALI